MLVVVWTIGLLVICMILYVTYKQRFSRIGRIAAKLPGPKLAFLVGNAFGSTPVELFRGLVKVAADYGDVVRLWFGTSLYILISDLKDIEYILINNYDLDKSQTYHFVKEGWLGDGLVTAVGEKWRIHRKTLGPAFHMKILEGFMDVFNKNSYILVKKLKSEIGKPDFDVEPYVSNCALDIVCESVMGTTINAQSETHCEFHQAIKDVTSSTISRVIQPWLHPRFLFKISPTGRVFYRSVKYLQDFVNQVIEKKKELHEKNKRRMEGNGKHAEENGVLGSRKRYAFLDLMLEYRDEGNEAYSDDDIRDEVHTFMFAGQDTVESAISFALYLIAHHQDVQEEIVKELADVFGDSDREETFQDLQNMNYLERVIKETLRMYPAGPMLGRLLSRDITLPSGHTLPAGSSLFLFLYRLLHNPNIYPNPEEFNPDNFLPDKVQNRLSNAYCPFGVGPRNCIGQRFAMLEMKSMLSSILRKFKLLPSESGPGLVLSTEFILRSATGIHVRIEKRT